MSENTSSCPIQIVKNKLQKFGKYCFGDGAIEKLLKGSAKQDTKKSITRITHPYNTIQDIMDLNEYQSIDQLVAHFNKISQSKSNRVNIEEIRAVLKNTYEDGDIKKGCVSFYKDIIGDKDYLGGNQLKSRATRALGRVENSTLPIPLEHKPGKNKEFDTFFKAALLDIGFCYLVADQLKVPPKNIVPAVKKLVTHITTTSLQLLSFDTYYFQCIDFFSKAGDRDLLDIDKITKEMFYYDEKTNTIATSLLFTKKGKCIIGTGLCPVIGLNYKDKDNQTQSCYNILFQVFEEVLREHSKAIPRKQRKHQII